MYKYVLNSVVKISMIVAKYFEYYTIILGGGAFLWTHCNLVMINERMTQLGAGISWYSGRLLCCSHCWLRVSWSGVARRQNISTSWTNVEQQKVDCWRHCELVCNRYRLDSVAVIMPSVHTTRCGLKMPPYYLLNNAVKNEPILIIFGRRDSDEISHFILTRLFSCYPPFMALNSL